MRAAGPRRLPGKHARRRAAKIAGSRYVVPPGYRPVPHYASDMTPCWCITHQIYGVPATSCAWYVDTATDRYVIQCLNCGAKWSRAVIGPMRRKQLHLDGGHPEERAAREERRR